LLSFLSTGVGGYNQTTFPDKIFNYFEMRLERERPALSDWNLAM